MMILLSCLYSCLFTPRLFLLYPFLLLFIPSLTRCFLPATVSCDKPRLKLLLCWCYVVYITLFCSLTPRSSSLIFSSLFIFIFLSSPCAYILQLSRAMNKDGMFLLSPLYQLCPPSHFSLSFSFSLIHLYLSSLITYLPFYNSLP